MVFAGAWAVWTGAGWILLAGRVRPRLIAVGGLLTAVGFATLRRLAAVYLPNVVATNQEQFGVLGVAFTLFSWLSACAFVVVVATVVGAVLAEDSGGLGRFIRAPSGEISGARRRPTSDRCGCRAARGDARIRPAPSPRHTPGRDRLDAGSQPRLDLPLPWPLRQPAMSTALEGRPRGQASRLGSRRGPQAPNLLLLLLYCRRCERTVRRGLASPGLAGRIGCRVRPVMKHAVWLWPVE